MSPSAATTTTNKEHKAWSYPAYTRNTSGTSSLALQDSITGTSREDVPVEMRLKSRNLAADSRLHSQAHGSGKVGAGGKDGGLTVLIVVVVWLAAAAAWS